MIVNFGRINKISQAKTDGSSDIDLWEMLPDFRLIAVAIVRTILMLIVYIIEVLPSYA